MAMYVFQELKPKVFYFTYCLQEIAKYIGFLEEANGVQTTPGQVRDNIHKIHDQKYITNWETKEYGYEKKFSYNFEENDKPINPQTLFLVNNLKATFHHCFTQYKMFNNIEEDVNLSTDLFMRKYSEGSFPQHDPVGKYTARLYVNNSFAGGGIKIHGLQPFNADGGSIIIAPSDVDISAEPSFKSSRYIGYGYWI